MTQLVGTAPSTELHRGRAFAADQHARNEKFSTLMQAAQRGDSRAYATLLSELLPLLRRTISGRYRFLQASDVEDLVQEILLSLHAARATYDPARPFTPWLMAITHNRLVDGARRQTRRATHETLVDELPDHCGDDATVPGEHSYGDPEELRRAVGALPSGQRRAIELLKLRELSLKEASAATGMSVSALKVSVHRAIKSLRGQLNA
jgi:RNA polymerase sigma factor (sigma-70 family)